jgi:hypothetical protein
MNWDAISSIAEIIAAVGVILSLLYVGRELKQSNLMARSATRQEINTAVNNWSMSIATSPTLSEDIAKAQLGGLVRNDASDAQKIRISYTLFAMINQQLYAYEQWKEGIISEKELNEIFGPGTANILTSAYLHSAWPIIRLSFPSEFAEWYTERYGLHEEVE